MLVRVLKKDIYIILHPSIHHTESTTTIHHPSHPTQLLASTIHPDPSQTRGPHRRSQPPPRPCPNPQEPRYTRPSVTTRAHSQDTHTWRPKCPAPNRSARADPDLPSVPFRALPFPIASHRIASHPVPPTGAVRPPRTASARNGRLATLRYAAVRYGAVRYGTMEIAAMTRHNICHLPPATCHPSRETAGERMQSPWDHVSAVVDYLVYRR
ncbi:hypothetical protein PMIN01_03625 [Paraphaeosphaeria minitans]|uniref:Uncharacterized protein n=1 Tax=Paraphaeosphaeria minitans TaxID=565426 RepID=A0A9P6GME6_9PLEO|nr:hypothetical protein PMIN01_03625 [Paraphaeosphaeria minitans]